MEVVRKCYDRMRQDCRRISVSIKIDARQGAEDRLSYKIKRVQSEVGRTLET